METKIVISLIISLGNGFHVPTGNNTHVTNDKASVRVQENYAWDQTRTILDHFFYAMDNNEPSQQNKKAYLQRFVNRTTKKNMINTSQNTKTIPATLEKISMYQRPVLRLEMKNSPEEQYKRRTKRETEDRLQVTDLKEEFDQLLLRSMGRNETEQIDNSKSNANSKIHKSTNVYDNEEEIFDEYTPPDELNPRGLTKIETSKTLLKSSETVVSFKTKNAKTVHGHDEQTVKQELKSKIDILINELEELNLNTNDIFQKGKTRSSYDQSWKSASIKFNDVKRDDDIDNGEDINLRQDDLDQRTTADNSKNLYKNKVVLITFITGVVLDEISSMNYQNEFEHEIRQIQCIILKLFENLTPNTSLYQTSDCLIQENQQHNVRPIFDRNTFTPRSFHDCYDHGDGNGIICFHKNNNFHKTDTEDIEKSNHQTPFFNILYASAEKRKRRSSQDDGETSSCVINFFMSRIKRVLNNVFPNLNGDAEAKSSFQDKCHEINNVLETALQNDESISGVERKEIFENDERFGEKMSPSKYETITKIPIKMNVNSKEVVENAANLPKDTKDNKATNILITKLIDAILKTTRNRKLHNRRTLNEDINDMDFNSIESVEHVEANQKTKEIETLIKNNEENYSKMIEDKMWNNPSVNKEKSKSRNNDELMNSLLKQLVKKQRTKDDINNEVVMNKLMDVLGTLFEKSQCLEVESNYDVSTNANELEEKPVSLKNSERHANINPDDLEKLRSGKFEETNSLPGMVVLLMWRLQPNACAKYLNSDNPLLSSDCTKYVQNKRNWDLGNKIASSVKTVTNRSTTIRKVMFCEKFTFITTRLKMETMKKNIDGRGKEMARNILDDIQ